MWKDVGNVDTFIRNRINLYEKLHESFHEKLHKQLYEKFYKNLHEKLHERDALRVTWTSCTEKKL